MAILNKYEWIFFDMDGTLADSINQMYGIYQDFLKEHKLHGTLGEFSKLNGPSLKEIVSYLKKRYTLKENMNKLMVQYEKKMIEAYGNKILPRKGSNRLLTTLKKNNYKLALVTSANKKIATEFIKNNNWKKFFSVIVFGDEVKNSKPKPDIYQLCLKKTRADKKRVIVVEDSENGYKSALNAGLNCVMVDSNEKLFEKISKELNIV